MSNNPNGNGLNESTKRQLELLRQSPTLFNMLSLTPSAVTYNIDIEKMEQYVADIAAKYLGKEEVRMATIDPQSRTREPLCYIWLKSDSRHLVDKSDRADSNQVFVPKISKFSDELKRFGEQFCPTERSDGTPINRKKMIQIRKNDKPGDQSIVAVPISLSRMLNRIFDIENRAFIDTYGTGVSAPRCNLKCSLRYVKKRDGNSSLASIQVVKRLDTDSMNRRPRPVGSFRDGDDNED